MVNDKAGLSKYNPLCNSKFDNQIYEYAPFSSIYASNNHSYVMTLDITGLLKEKLALSKLYSSIHSYTLRSFEEQLNSLLKNMSQSENEENEQFWEDMHVLEEILLKISMNAECRQMLIAHQKDIMKILQIAVTKEVASGINDIRYKIIFFYVSNKFCLNSNVNDDILFNEILKKCFNNDKPDIDLFIYLSIYKNCDKFDVSWQDVLASYMSNIKYFWIYTPYVIKYSSLIEKQVRCSSSEEIYNEWFGYIASGQFSTNCSNYSNGELISIANEVLVLFEQCGVYTYDKRLLLNKINKERGH